MIDDIDFREYIPAPLRWISDELQKLNLVKVSVDTGLHYNTLYGIKAGTSTNPTLHTLATLTEYLKQLGE